MMTSSYSETYVSVRSHVNKKPAFSKMSTLRTVLASEIGVFVSTEVKVKTGKKSPFSKISGGGLNDPGPLED